MGLQNSPVGSQSWLSALLSWVKSTVKHSDLIDVKPVAYENDGIMDKHVSSLIYKRSVDHISDNSRHLTDFLDGQSNYIGSLTSPNTWLDIDSNGSAYTLTVQLTIGNGLQKTGTEISLNIAPGNGISISSGAVPVITANIAEGNGITVSGTTTRTIHAHHFARTVQIVSTACDDPIDIVLDSEVPSGMNVIVEGFYAYVYGATDWTAGGLVLTDLRIEDTDLNELFHINIARLTGNAIIHPASLGSSEVTSRLVAGTGSATGKGIQAVGWNGLAHVAAGSGSDVWLTVFGVIR